jgi:hypothetical protein
MSSLLAPVLLTLLSSGQVGDARDQADIGKVDHRGYVLTGPRGRHYIFGGLAIADYTDSAGKRLIVTMQEQDDSAALPDNDKFLYFREIASGNRWSFARVASANGKYAVHFQPYQDQVGAARPAWQAFHQADFSPDHIYGANLGIAVPEGGTARGDLQFRQPNVPFVNPPRVATVPGTILQDYQPRYVQPTTPVYIEAGGCCGR